MQAADSRLTFHPDYELPLMRAWYRACKNPTLVELQDHLRELNSSAFRQERPNVTLVKLKNWWKNERQRERKKKDRPPNKSNNEENERHSVEEEDIVVVSAMWYNRHSIFTDSKTTYVS